MQVGYYGSLLEFAAKAPIQDQSFADTLREKGQKILAAARDTYSDPKRTREAGATAMADVTDLERAMKEIVNRTKAERAENGQKLEQTIDHLNQTGVADGTLHPAGTVSVSSEKEATLPGCRNGDWQKGLTNGRLTYQDEVAGPIRPAFDKMEGVSAFIVTLHDVAGLLDAAFESRPSHLNVNTFAREESLAASHQESSSNIEGSSAERSSVLLGLGATRASNSQMAGSSHSAADSNFAFDKTTTDERIIPVLRDLIERLDQTSIYPAEHCAVRGYQVVSGVRINTVEPSGMLALFKSAKTVESPMSWMGTYVSNSQPVQQGNATFGQTWYPNPLVVRDLSSVPFEPSHIRLPMTGVSDFQH
jgi:hypothetical protein